MEWPLKLKKKIEGSCYVIEQNSVNKKRKKKLTALSKPFFESNTITFAIIAGSCPCSLFSGNTVTSLTARALSLAEYAGITRKKLKWKRYDNNISDH